MEEKTEKKNQHYVPQFYLRHFSNNGNSIAIYLFKQQKLVKQASIRNIMASDYFYGKDGKVEDKLAEFEGKWDNIIEEILHNKTIPDDPEIITLLKFFLLVGSGRTALRGSELIDLYTEVLKSITKSTDTLLYSAICEGKIKLQSNAPALPSINAAQRSLLTTFDLKIDLIENRTKYDFITSDNPVVFYNPLYEYYQLKSGFGYAQIGIILICPLSPKYMLCMYDGDAYTLNKKIKSDYQVKMINDLLLDNSNELIAFYLREGSNITNYIERIVKHKVGKAPITKMGNCLCVSNRQIFDKHNLKGLFGINPKYTTQRLSDPTQEEIEKSINSEIRKKIDALSEKEIRDKADSGEQMLIGAGVKKNIRPWCRYLIENELL